jgi:two-component system sensor histidine kinase PilS (NtrC family)
MKPPAAAIPASSASTDLAWRVLSLVNLFRLLAPLLLMALFVTVTPRLVGQAHPTMFFGGLVAYFAFAMAVIPSLKHRWPVIELLTTVSLGIDVVIIVLLTYASGGMSSGLAALLVAPMGAAAFVVRQRLGLLFAAVGALALLAQQGLTALTLRGDASDFAAAGIVGALMFVVALGVGPLARGLRESEELVRQREVDVANLAELNQFIVQHLRESILVVDEDTRILLINESAALLLKGPGGIVAGTLLADVAPRLLYMLKAWKQHKSDWQISTLSLLSSDGGSMIQPHFVSLDRTYAGPTLIFLEDTTLIAERVQQSKLAALGRLSASIAHEIRNPVGAMSHAAQLLAESPAIPEQERRLTTIITNNGERVSTIIDNVLQLSRRDSTRQERVDLNAWLQEFLGEFRQTMQADESIVQAKLPPDEIEVRVDPSHLHQLLWNLCENALKYGRSPADDPIEVLTGRMPLSERPFLEVCDRGSGIATAETERIFEPFFTGGRGGTGLGLFIARELAQCNRAILVYEPRNGGGSIFRIVFADPQRWEMQ